MSFFEMERNSFHREDYYLAQIAAEVRRSIVKRPQDVDVKDFLLSFVPEKKRGNGEAENPSLIGKKKDGIPLQTSESRLQKSKNYWFALLGVNKK